MKLIKFFTIIALVSITLYSCKKDTPEPVNEEEVITTVEITLQNGDNTVILKSYDADGEGAGEPEITVSGNLVKNTSYSGTIKLLNETEKPAENITEEVEEEALVHQFFYSSKNKIVNFSYADKDANGTPIGIKFNLITTAAGNDNLTFTLRHEPDKLASGVSSGDITNAGGSTDVDVTFGVTIE